MSARAANLAQRFAEVVGREPVGVWSAPGRVNLIGEHVDYSEGVVLPLAINARTFVAAAPRTDGLVVARSLQRDESLTSPTSRAVTSLEPHSESGWSSYALGAVWALRKDQGSDLLADGLDLLIDGEVPEGAGLSSSAALECAVVLAAAGIADLDLSPLELARLGQHAENDFVGMPCGLMDQVAAMCCTAGHALLLDTRDETLTQVPMNLAAHGLALLVIRTPASRNLRDGAYAERTRSVEAIAAHLQMRSLREATLAMLSRIDDPVLKRRAEHVICENERVRAAVDALRSDNFIRLGALMTQSHASLRDLFEVSCEQLDLAVDSALDAGALGARMTGGGFGGSAIALVAGASVASCTDAVSAAFTAHGHPSPEFEQVAPCNGATREM